MSEAKYLGSSFGYEEDTFQYNVSFTCEEKIDSETGIAYADIQNIKVTDRVGDAAESFVDMEEVTRLCHNKAIDAISRMTRENGMNGN